MSKKIDSIFNKITLVMTVVAALSLIFCISLNFYEIVNRYFFGKSLYWIQDVTLLLMMWFIFPGITRVTYDKQDILIDILTVHLPPRVRYALEAFINALVSAFSFLMVYESYRYILLNWNKNMSISNIPTRYYIVTILFSFFLVALLYAFKTTESARKIRKEN